MRQRRRDFRSCYADITLTSSSNPSFIARNSQNPVGSAIRDDFRPGESDIDLLVEFSPIGGHAKFHAYFEMPDELQRVLGGKVDLVMSGAVHNAIIAREIARTKQIVYAA